MGKNFASTMSPWIITLDALEPFRCAAPEKEIQLLPYLQQKLKDTSIDIHLKAFLTTENGEENLLTETNFKNMYWSMSQQLAHHTVNGCNVRSGDLMGSGTISGTDKGSFGSMLELTWGGKEPLTLKDGSTRTFFNDGDKITITGSCTKDTVKIGFGKCEGKLLPPVKYKFPV